jgi:type II secretion system protein G
VRDGAGRITGGRLQLGRDLVDVRLCCPPTARGSAREHARCPHPAHDPPEVFMNRIQNPRGFTLVELVVVVAILAILAGSMIPHVTNRMALSRDARRVADLENVKSAIDKFHGDKGRYPAAKQNASYGGWDVSQDGDFIPELVAEGYLTTAAKDPINDETFQYRYFVYDKGSAGCNGDAAFYVLGARAFETNEFARKNKGQFKCSSRNWGDEFAYVTGGGAQETQETATGPFGVPLRR